MGHLLGIRIQRYKALRDVTLGKYEYDANKDDLPALTALIGPNGSGKSTVLDAFGFLADCLAENVEAACDRPHRGGFENLRTKGESGPIQFDLYYREDKSSRPISYSLGIDLKDGVPVVAWEKLLQRRKGQKHGRPFPFVNLEFGKGTAWAGLTSLEGEESASVDIELNDVRKLGIITLGQLKEHPRVLGLRAFIEGWYLSYFVPDAARTLPVAGVQKHLNRTGDNLANVVQYMERHHKEAFQGVLAKIAKRIPGIRDIKTMRSQDGRLLIAFDEQGFRDPLYAANMSDGTLKLFAYLLLLEDPEPRPFIGIEEPENGLYHRLLPRLAEELKKHAAQRDTNVLVTTHSPYFVDALTPEQVWRVRRNEKGHSELTRASDVPNVKQLVEEGLTLGGLWYSNHFDDRVSQ